MDTSSSLLSVGRGWFSRRALFFKILGVGFLGLLLLIPLGMVRETLNERLGRHQQAVAEITQTWGQAQRLIGPVLVVPFRQRFEHEQWVVVDGNRTREIKVSERTGEAWFLPEQLTVKGTLNPLELTRGIYRTTVYGSTLTVSGGFRRPDFASLGLSEATPQWERARVGVALSDLRGIQGEVTLSWNGQPVVLETGTSVEGLGQGLHRTVDLREIGETVAFSLQLSVNGSDGFSVVPVGRQTEVSFASSWPSPGFQGAFLPVEREVSPDGFAATWKTSHHARAFPQQGMRWDGPAALNATELAEAAFGVRLVDTVTAYRTVERSIKHGVLFIALVFAVFFLFEALGGARLHALNYLLVGVALCLFYLSLLALSEFVPFAPAYGLAAGASTLLIGLYARSVLGGLGRAATISALLGAVYGYLFLVVRMEDFALLAGTAGLFAILAAIMYATRNLRTDPVPPEVTP